MLTPTTALMLEQTARLRKLGAVVACPNADNYKNKSGKGKEKYWAGVLEKVVNNKIDFLILSPERVVKNKYLRRIRGDMFSSQYLAYVFNDEVHLSTSWGICFRPDLNLKDVGEVIPRDIRMIGATATCTAKMMPDVCSALRFTEGDHIFFQHSDRPNLKIVVEDCWDMPRVKVRKKLLHAMINRMMHVGDKVIVFNGTCNNCNQMVGMCKAIARERLRVIDGGAFHSQITDAERKEVLEGYERGTHRVIFATTAFGLGMDSPNIRNIIFAGCPFSIQDLSQMLGRGGRDGKRALICIYLYKGAFSEAIRTLVYGSVICVNDGSDGLPKRFAIKPDSKLQKKFEELCEVLYLMVHKFKCIRQSLLDKFSPDYERKVDARFTKCADLMGEKCSGCTLTRYGRVNMNGREWSRGEVFTTVHKTKLVIVNILRQTNHGSWQNMMERFEENGLIAAWAMLELMLVDQLITITLVVSTETGKRKFLALKLVAEDNDIEMKCH